MKENSIIPYKMTMLQLWAFSLFCFTFFSGMALTHILVVMPGLMALAQLVKNKRVNLSGSTWSLLALLLICILSVLVNDIERPLKNIAKTKYFLLAILGIFSVSAYFDRLPWRKLIHWFFIASAIASASGLIAYFFGFNPLKFKPACHENRTCGMYGMYMSYAYGIGFVIILQIACLLHGKKLKNFLSQNIVAITLVINSVGFILSFARGSYLGLIMALPLLFVKKNVKVALGVFLAGAGILALSIMFIPRVNEVFTSVNRIKSIEIRLTQYETALKVFSEKPWLGIGYKNFEPNVLGYKKKYKINHNQFPGHGHSNFFEHLASTGALGLLALLAFHFFWLREVWRLDSPVSEIGIAFLGYLFISGQFQYTLGDGENLFLIMMMYTLSQAYILKERQHG